MTTTTLYTREPYRLHRWTLLTGFARPWVETSEQGLGDFRNGSSCRFRSPMAAELHGFRGCHRCRCERVASTEGLHRVLEDARSGRGHEAKRHAGELKRRS